MAFIKISTTELPRTQLASCLLPMPSSMDMRAAAPVPTSRPMAALRFITGNVTASPEMASAPTPRPMNMRSITLYNDITTTPTTAGRLYCHNRRPTGSEARRDIESFFSTDWFIVIIAVLTYCF